MLHNSNHVLIFALLLLRLGSSDTSQNADDLYEVNPFAKSENWRTKESFPCPLACTKHALSLWLARIHPLATSHAYDVYVIYFGLYIS